MNLVGIQRNNDEERVAIVERLVQEHRRLRAHQPLKAALRSPDGSERQVQLECAAPSIEREVANEARGVGRHRNEKKRRRKRSKAS